MRIFRLVIILLACIHVLAYGQMDIYDYQRTITSSQDENQWQRIDIPADLYTRANRALSDVRIYQVLPGSDTIEWPYVLDVGVDRLESKEIEFQLLNKSKRSNGQSFTFYLANKEIINEIVLDLNNSNFDWRLDLEGSSDQKSWNKILDDYRILSINSNNENYRFTKLLFPQSNFEYYRLTVMASDAVKLNKASLFFEKLRDTRCIDVPIAPHSIRTDKEGKLSIVDIDLQQEMMVDRVVLDIVEKGDYYRPIDIQILHDSSLIDQKWNYHYRSVYRGTLSSLERADFNVKGGLTKKLKIKIKNFDNPILPIVGVALKYRVRSFYAQLPSEGDLYLCYGNINVRSPNYDLKYFKDKIQLDGDVVELGSEIYKPKFVVDQVKPLFNNKWWLWALLIFLVLGLGWMSIGMLKEENH